MAMHKYVLYGLGVHSEIALWGDEVATAPRDVVVSLDTRGEAAEPVAAPAESPGPLNEIRLTWPTMCEMSIRAGREIVVRTLTPYDDESQTGRLRHLVSGIALGLTLYQRGRLTLHASAVSVCGQAVVIAGPKGAGKSTLAAALAERGHAVLTDDVVAFDLSDGTTPRVQIGPPNTNLWPDSAIATGQDLATLAPICAEYPKLAGRVSSATSREPVPLGAVVILTDDGEPEEFERLAPVDAFTQLVAHSHAFRWIEGAPDLPRHLAQCQQVLARAPVFRLRRGDSLTSLPALAASVEELVTDTYGAGAIAGQLRMVASW